MGMQRFSSSSTRNGTTSVRCTRLLFGIGEAGDALSVGDPQDSRAVADGRNRFARVVEILDERDRVPIVLNPRLCSWDF